MLVYARGSDTFYIWESNLFYVLGKEDEMLGYLVNGGDISGIKRLDPAGVLETEKQLKEYCSKLLEELKK